MRLVFTLLILVALSGCVPASIKTEINFVDVIVQVGAKEVEGFDSASTAKKVSLGRTAVRAIRRLQPHTANLKRWVEGEDSDAD